MRQASMTLFIVAVACGSSSSGGGPPKLERWEKSLPPPMAACRASNCRFELRRGFELPALLWVEPCPQRPCDVRRGLLRAEGRERLLALMAALDGVPLEKIYGSPGSTGEVVSELCIERRDGSSCHVYDEAPAELREINALLHELMSTVAEDRMTPYVVPLPSAMVD